MFKVKQDIQSILGIAHSLLSVLYISVLAILFRLYFIARHFVLISISLKKYIVFILLR